MNRPMSQKKGCAETAERNQCKKDEKPALDGQGLPPGPDHEAPIECDVDDQECDGCH
jgi:hypothetical protein